MSQELRDSYGINLTIYFYCQLPANELVGLRLRKKSCRVWPVDTRLAKS